MEQEDTKLKLRTLRSLRSEVALPSRGQALREPGQGTQHVSGKCLADRAAPKAFIRCLIVGSTHWAQKGRLKTSSWPEEAIKAPSDQNGEEPVGKGKCRPTPINEKMRKASHVGIRFQRDQICHCRITSSLRLLPPPTDTNWPVI